jgi:hypothetical protein
VVLQHLACGQVSTRTAGAEQGEVVEDLACGQERHAPLVAEQGAEREQA